MYCSGGQKERAKAMHRLIRRVFIWVFIFVGITGCSSIPGLVSNASSAKNLLFQDDFSDPGSGWHIARNGDLVIDYDNGSFLFQLNQAYSDFWSLPGLMVSDVQVEVDAIRMDGSEDNDLGIICRYQDQNNFYGLIISSDGYYGISKMENGEHKIIGAEGMQYSDNIHRGTEMNHIQANCVGSTLTLMVNGEKLIEVQDSDFVAGDTGLTVGTFSEPQVKVQFDNFIVKKP